MQDDASSPGDLAEPEDDTRNPHGGGSSAEPDVLLDVPQLRVDEITLDVEDLDAHVSVQADVLNLLRLSIGADVQLGGVHLDIKGVEAQVLLKVRLEKIAQIINRVLSTVDRNPEIVSQVLPSVEAAAGEVTGELAGATEAVGEVARGTESSVADALDTAGGAAALTDESAESPEQTTRQVPRRRKRPRKTEEPPA